MRPGEESKADRVAGGTGGRSKAEATCPAVRPYAADGVNAAADTWRCLATEERTVFDHIGVGVSDPKASKAFFLQGFPH